MIENRRGRMSKKIQRLELDEFHFASTHCPFCGQKVVDYRGGEIDGNWVKPCPHTLFAAHDYGFTFRSARCDEVLNLNGIENEDEIETGENGIDGFTDGITTPNAIKFVSYQGPPSGFGSYVGFAPVDDETE